VAKNNQKNQNRNGQSSGKYYRLYLFQTLVSWGFVPPLNATVKVLRSMLETALIQLSIAEGTYEMDPEIPDNEITGLIPALSSRGIGKADVANVLGLARAGGATLVGVDGELTTIGEAATQNDSWTENTQAWWNSTWGLNGEDVDWNEGWNQFCQGWDDFWAGNF